MTNKPTDNPQELLIESQIKKVDDRPKKLQHLIDTQAMRFLEAMDFQSFNDLSGAFEQFMSAAPMFQGDVSFSRAAMALDLTARLFPIIDTDKNSLLSREEFAYMLLKTNDANRQALAWLIENFQAFTQACFFQDQISKEDIEASRNVFHGLKICQEKFGFTKEPTSENLAELDPDKIKDYLDKNKDTLTPHETSGLTYLLDHIKKKIGFRKKGDRAEKGEGTEENETEEDLKLKALEGVLDKRSLKTLQGLKLNNFDSLFTAFMDFMEDPESFRGRSPFAKAAGVLNTTADAMNELDMGEDYAFTRGEMLIVSKMTKNEKKPLNWFAKHFDALSKLFFKSGKSKRRDIISARNVFTGIDVMDERFNFEEELRTSSREELDMRIRTYLRGHHQSMHPSSKVGLEQLLHFMEKHAQEQH